MPCYSGYFFLIFFLFVLVGLGFEFMALHLQTGPLPLEPHLQSGGHFLYQSPTLESNLPLKKHPLALFALLSF
jgi:hypothetical protein